MKKVGMVRTMQGILLVAVVVGLFLAMQGVASAGLIGVRLISSGVTTTCLDNAGCDTNPTLGVVSFSGSVGSFLVNITTAISYPILGTPAAPWIDMNSVNVTTTGPGTLEILASQTDYTGAIANSLFKGGGSQTNMTSLHQIWLANSNVQFELGTLIDSQAVPDPNSSFSWANNPPNPGADAEYSLTFRAVLTALAGTATVSFNEEYIVPEPAWGLLLSPLLALVGLMGRRRRVSIGA